MDIIVKVMADGLMLPLVLTALYGLVFLVPNVVRYDRYTRIFMAGLTSYWLAKVLGFLWQPEQLRPFEKLGLDAGASYLNNPGFPSDHALFAAFLTIAVAYGTRSKLLTSLMVVFTLLICLGRVAALVHTPLDVIGGVFVAALGAIWYLPEFYRFQKRVAKKSNK